ncbi:hypothetical protein PLESTB_000445300 [Pleodorina starrii]|uniref:RHOMBOID-like protein n=1 Tax=Pleodorina starrii TaxID=330485 RepID=A0A9W6BET9_9CHLO|nr:hypothetical protein PLESTM_000675500 [Pleodorina starrii]GLC50906.1 hypothetical protein PLESTB_000445300 [Pleodorina starrii]GLC73901.1 hypothetical protein PLESTF_001435400 [Pleodorina starrii]
MLPQAVRDPSGQLREGPVLEADPAAQTDAPTNSASHTVALNWHETGELSFRLPNMAAAAAAASPLARRAESSPLQSLADRQSAAAPQSQQMAEDEGGGEGGGGDGGGGGGGDGGGGGGGGVRGGAAEDGEGRGGGSALLVAVGPGQGPAPNTAAEARQLMPPPPPRPPPSESCRRRSRSSDGGSPWLPPPPSPQRRPQPRATTPPTARPRAVDIPAAVAERNAVPAAAAAGGGVYAGPTATAAAAAANALHDSSAADEMQQQQQQRFLQDSILVASAVPDRAGTLRRRTSGGGAAAGSHTLPPPPPPPPPKLRSGDGSLPSPPQLSPQAQAHGLRNHAAAPSTQPLELSSGPPPPFPVSPQTRLAAALSIRSSNGGGAGGDAGGGGGGAPGDGDESGRHSWGSVDDSGAAGACQYGNPYGTEVVAVGGGGGDDEPQRGSWGSCDASGALYGSRGGGGGGGGGDAADGAQLPPLRSAGGDGPSPGLLSPPDPSPGPGGGGGGGGQSSSAAAAAAAARERWRKTVVALQEIRRQHGAGDTLADTNAAPSDRLAAAVCLVMQRHRWDRLMPSNNPHRRLLQHYMDKKRAGQWGSLGERLQAEFVIAGTIVFDWCTPARMGEHWPLFTPSLLAATSLLFAFMSGQYPYWAALAAGAAGACGQLAGQRGAEQLAAACWSSCFLTPRSGPAFLRDVLLHPTAQPATTFSAAFLRDWGGLYLPDVRQRGQVYRWLTSPLLHTSFRHLAANLALTAALGWQMETKYGTVRVVAVWLAAVVGGELLSAAVEDPCRQVVGCSGGAFGLLGLFCADTLLHYSALRQPLLRCAAIAVLLGLLVYTLAAQQGGVSSMAHLGGLLCGLLPALLVLPRLGSERWEAAWPALGLTAVLTWFSVLPAWVACRRLPAAEARCGPLGGAPQASAL